MEEVGQTHAKKYIKMKHKKFMKKKKSNKRLEDIPL